MLWLFFVWVGRFTSKMKVVLSPDAGNVAISKLVTRLKMMHKLTSRYLFAPNTMFRQAIVFLG